MHSNFGEWDNIFSCKTTKMLFYSIFIIKLASLLYIGHGYGQLIVDKKSCDCHQENDFIVCENCDSVSVQKKLTIIAEKVKCICICT